MQQITTENVITAQNAAESMGRYRQMNSWNQPQQQNNTLNPYWNMRGPVYKADPIHGKEAAWAFPIGGGEIWLPDAD